MKFSLLATQVAVLLQLSSATTTGCSGALNNLQRCFISSSTSASSFCSLYLSIPVKTVTFTPSAFTTLPSIASTATKVVTSTVTLTTYSTAVATTISSSSTTSLDVITATETLTAYSTAVATSEDTVFTTITTTVPAPVLPAKRAVSSQFKCITSSGTVLYPASVISSACSCLAVSTKTVTATANTFTRTSYSATTQSTATTTTLDVSATSVTSTTTTIITTVLVTSYITSTLTVPTTVITSTTTTTTETDTAISTATLIPVPTCDPGTAVTAQGLKYNRFFTGAGVSENPSNPSNDQSYYYPPVQTTFSGTLSCADAAVACVNFSFALPMVYWNFDLHYLLAEQEWACVCYLDAFSSAADFNVVNTDIGVSFGYQI